jgi:acyl-CoA thioesterase
VAEDLLESVRARARGNAFWQYLGISVEAASEGFVRLRVPVRDELRNAPGAPVHGGVLATLVDAAVGGALGTYGSAAAGGVDQATLDLNVSFVGGPAATRSTPRGASCAAGARSLSARRA